MGAQLPRSLFRAGCPALQAQLAWSRLTGPLGRQASDRAGWHDASDEPPQPITTDFRILNREHPGASRSRQAEAFSDVSRHIHRAFSHGAVIHSPRRGTTPSGPVPTTFTSRLPQGTSSGKPGSARSGHGGGGWCSTLRRRRRLPRDCVEPFSVDRLLRPATSTTLELLTAVKRSLGFCGCLQICSFPCAPEPQES
jgi:hypothetical protein